MEPPGPPQPQEPVPVDLRDYVDFRLDEPAATRVYATGTLALDLICLEPHQVLPARMYDEATVVYTVLGGRAWVVTDEAEVTLGSLQAVLVPPAVPHGVRNDSPDPLILQAVVGPPGHEDFDPPVRPRTKDAHAPPSEPAQRPGLLDRLRRGLGG